MLSVLVNKDQAIARVVLNRPEQLNSLNYELISDLFAALDLVSQDETVRCVVISGAGEHFMAGGDIKYFQESLPEMLSSKGEALLPLFELVHGVIQMIQTMPKPVIASVKGAVAGFGLSLMMACDLALAADTAKFATAYKHLALSPDGGSTYFLPRLVGSKKAAELVLLAERFDATEALRLGLINKCVSDADLSAATNDWAAKLAVGSVHATIQAKRLLHQSEDVNLQKQLDAEKNAFIACTQTTDFSEGVAAFCEKRAAKFA